MIVLIVDDDESIREIVKVMLKDYIVLEATNGFEAVEIYKKERPDVVLMDINMPMMDGVEATKEILKLDPEAVILALTAFARSRGKEIIMAGAKGVIEKPFTRKKLVEILEKFAAKAYS